MQRPVLVVLAVLALAAAMTLFLLWREPAQPGTPGAPAGKAGNAADALTGELRGSAGTDASGPGRTAADMGAEGALLTVTGRVLADARAPVDGAEVLAYRGKASDRGGFAPLAMMGQDPRKLDENDASFLTSGPVLARARVDQSGAFQLQVRERHLRLELEHDLYGMALPEIVHVPADAEVATVVLEPYLGACLRGRALGADPLLVRKVRLLVEPDPLTVMRDPGAFMGTMLRARRDADYTAATGEFVVRAAIVNAATTVLAEGDEVAGRLVVPALQPAETREVALPLVRAGRLKVLARGEDDAPIAGARIELHADGPATAMARQLSALRARTDQSGTAEVRGVLPGTWRVHAEASGRLDGEAVVTLPGTSEVKLQLLRGGTVAGTVVDEAGKAIALARVAPMQMVKVPMFGDMTEQLGLDLLAHAAHDGSETDQEGRFTVGGIPDDEPFQLIAVHAEHAPGSTRGVRRGDREVRIVLPAACGLSGTVVAAEDGAALPAFEVEVQTTMFLMIRRPVRTEQVRSEQGTFRLTGIGPGSYTLLARAEGRSDAQTEVTLRPGTVVEAAALRLHRGAIVHGTVRDNEGKPVARALVKQSRGGLADNPMLAMLQGSSLMARTDERGAYVLRDLPPGRLQLVADAEGYAQGRSARLSLAAGAELRDVDLTLDHGGSIEGVVRAAPGDAVAEFLVIAQEQQSQKTQTTRPGADGSFGIDNLEPGRYQVQAMHPVVMGAMQQGGGNDLRPGRGFDIGGMMQQITEHVVSQKVVVRAGETATVELDASGLGTGVRLDLQVRIGGELLQEGLLEVTDLQDGRIRTAFMDGGRASIGSLQPGPLRVQVRAGLTMAPVGAPQDVEVPRGTDHHRATLQLPGGELRGRVVDVTSSAPLPGVLVRLLPGDVAAADDLLGTALTGSAGEFAFRALRPGSYGLIAADVLLPRDRVGAASRQDGIAVAEGQVVEGIVLRAQPAAGVTVAVTDEAGAPVGGAMLLAVDAEGRALGGFAIAITAADGRAVLGGLPRGSMRVVGRGAGLAPDATAVFEAMPGEVQEKSLMLRRGTNVVLDAVSAQGLSLQGAEVTARCNDGPWFPALILVEGRSRTGHLDLGRLAGGNWQFRISHPATGTFTVQRGIGGGATVTILASPR